MRALREHSEVEEGLRARAEKLLSKTPHEVAQMPVEDVQKLVHELQVHQIELEMQNDELRRTQLELEAARDSYADLFDFAPTAFLTLDARGRIEASNLAAGNLLGLARRELIQEKFTRFIAGEAQDDFYLYQRQVLNSKKKSGCELNLVSAKGESLTVQMQGIVIDDPRPGQAQWRLTLNDITEHKQAEEELRRSEERYRTLVEQASDGLFVTDARASRLLDVNSACHRMTGYSREELLKMSVMDMVVPEEVPRIASEIARLASGKNVFSEWRMRRKDGTLFPGEITARQTADGRIQGFIRDITERKRAEERIGQLNRIQAILAGVDRAIVHIPDRQKLLDEICRVAVEKGGFSLAWIGMVAPDGTVQPVAQAGATKYLHGIRVTTSSDVPEGCGPVGTAIRENRTVVISDVDRDARMGPWYARARRFGLRYVAAFPIRIAGKVVGALQVYTSKVKFFDESELSLMTQASNDISFALTTMEDLAARKQAKEALRRSEHHLSNFFNQSPVGLEWLSASGVILRTNQAQLEMLGYSAKEYLGHFFTEFCEAPALGLELLKRLTAEETVRNFRLAQRRKDGGICHVLVDAVSFRMDGQFQYSSIFLRDITARVNLEREVLHVSEWEHRRIAQDLHDGLGQLLVGTVHLTSALQKEVAVKSLSDSRYLHRILKLLNEAVARTRSLARGLHPVEPESDGLMASLEALAKRTKSLFQVACRFHYQRPVLIYDNAVATHLYRIAQEAITNAIKHAKPKRIEISLSETAGRINLTIRDDGTGLPAHRRKEPGMGLRIMRYRAGMIGGSLAVEKEDRRGTKVTCSVRLPVGNVSDRPAPARRRKK